MGRTKYNKSKDNCIVSKMSTASDEALVVLCIKNSHARWTWEAKDPTKREDIEKPKPIYTDSSNKAYKYGGWTEKGIACYNELTGTLIPALRKSTVGVETDLRETYVLDAQERSGKCKHKEVSNKKVTVAIMEPSSDESSDEEEDDGYKEDDACFQEHGSDRHSDD